MTTPHSFLRMMHIIDDCPFASNMTYLKWLVIFTIALTLRICTVAVTKQSNELSVRFGKYLRRFGMKRGGR
jgi:hypothetical protein